MLNRKLNSPTSWWCWCWWWTQRWRTINGEGKVIHSSRVFFCHHLTLIKKQLPWFVRADKMFHGIIWSIYLVLNIWFSLEYRVGHNNWIPWYHHSTFRTGRWTDQKTNKKCLSITLLFVWMCTSDILWITVVLYINMVIIQYHGVTATTCHVIHTATVFLGIGGYCEEKVLFWTCTMVIPCYTLKQLEVPYKHQGIIYGIHSVPWYYCMIHYCTDACVNTILPRDERDRYSFFYTSNAKVLPCFLFGCVPC